MVARHGHRAATLARSIEVGLIKTGVRRLGIAGELLAFLARNKRWWIMPIIVVLLLIGVLLILAQSSVIAPFIYSLF